MSFLLHPPQRPEQEETPVAVPRIYVSEPVRWEYKQVGRDLEGQGLLDKAELNALGAEAWELAAVIADAQRVTYLFKRSTS